MYLMKQGFNPRRLILCATALALVALMASVSSGHELHVEIQGAWARPAIAHGNGAVYFSLTNLESEPLTLVGASAGVAQFVEVHETYAIDAPPGHDVMHSHGHASHEAGHDDHSGHGHESSAHSVPGASAPQAGATLGMRMVEAITVAPGETVHFAPAGYHVMLIQLNQALVWGERFELTLHFADGHSVTFEVEVGAGPAQ